ncbi:MAG: glycosyltransferase family 4 protein [Tahibacter sp.]
MPVLNRLAIVVQRCHPDVVGGSEALAWQYAQLLAGDYDVEILTSCALDYQTWNNVLPVGIERRDGIAVRRFATAFPRGLYFNQLHRRLLADFSASEGRDASDRLPWRNALAEEFIRFQGPWCPGLVEHVAQQHNSYHKLIFCTYLYPTTYFGLQQTPPEQRILVPTLHDEPPAYLPAYAAMARDCRLVWLTEAERTLGTALWNISHGDVVGMGVDAMAAAPASPASVPYLLYCGRIDESKGCRELIDAFLALRRLRREPFRLVLTGSDHLGLPDRTDIEFLGFVEEARKRELMAGARAFVMPSRYESFSIVTLEAMAQSTPVIVNADCAVLAEHRERSSAGFAYRGRAGLIEAMQDALDLDDSARRAMGARGRDYVMRRHAHAAVRARLLAVVA